MPKNWTFGKFITHTHTHPHIHEQRVKVSSRYFFFLCLSQFDAVELGKFISIFLPSHSLSVPKKNKFILSSKHRRHKTIFLVCLEFFVPFLLAAAAVIGRERKKAPLIRVCRKKMKSFHSQKLFSQQIFLSFFCLYYGMFKMMLDITKRKIL